MNMEDKIGNKVEDLKGKGKEHVGAATGDEQLEAEGKGDQAKSAIKDGVEKLKDAAKDIKDGLTK